MLDLSKALRKWVLWYLPYLVFTVTILEGCSDDNPADVSNRPPAAPSEPVPSDQATNQPVVLQLEWDTSDPESEPLTYDIYFGSDLQPPKVGADHSASSYELNDLDYGTTYYWKIVAKDAQDNTAAGPSWAFTTIANQGPAVPSSPLPFDGASKRPRDVTLSWHSSDPEDASLMFDVYLGTEEDPPLVESDRTPNYYQAAGLEFATTYYWRVVAKDDHQNEASGPIWRFTSVINNPPATPSDPFPPTGSGAHPSDVTLRWESFDPENDPLLYDAYFGTISNPPLAATGLTRNEYDPGPLEYGKRYYWRIIARDDYVNQTDGPLWRFTTAAGRWSAMDSGTNRDLNDVWAISPSNVVAVGDGGIIIHFDGVFWAPRASGTTTDLFGVWGSAADNMFAVGALGVILHYDGIRWSAQASGTTSPLLGIGGSSASDAWAVGALGEIRHYDADSWSLSPSQATYTLNDIWSVSASDAFAVGIHNTFQHFDGDRWKPLNDSAISPLYGVWASAPFDVYTVGRFGVVKHWDGGRLTLQSTGTNVRLQAVWGSAPNDVFAVGDDGTIIHRGGSIWSPMAAGTSRHLRSISGTSAANVYAVGDVGTVLHFAPR